MKLSKSPKNFLFAFFVNAAMAWAVEIYFLIVSHLGQSRISIGNDIVAAIYFINSFLFVVFFLLVFSIGQSVRRSAIVFMLVIALAPTLSFIFLNFSGAVCEIKKSSECIDLFGD